MIRDDAEDYFFYYATLPTVPGKVLHPYGTCTSILVLIDTVLVPVQLYVILLRCTCTSTSTVQVIMFFNFFICRIRERILPS